MFAVDKPRGGHKHLITRKREIYVKRIRKMLIIRRKKLGRILNALFVRISFVEFEETV